MRGSRDLRKSFRMASPELRFGIPNIEVGAALGLKINPSSFAGHELIVLFCPTDPGGAAQERAAYQAHNTDFVERDAWLLTFAGDGEAIVDGPARNLTIPDRNRRAWVAFRDLATHPEEFDRSSGATFLFTRGGNLRRYWHGPGHVKQVLEELQKPSFS